VFNDNYLFQLFQLFQTNKKIHHFYSIAVAIINKVLNILNITQIISQSLTIF